MFQAEAKSYTLDELLKIIHNMKAYGGHFARHLGDALLHADGPNTRRIEQAFPELLEKYAASHWK